MCICILHYQLGKLSESTVQLDLQLYWRVLCLSVGMAAYVLRCDLFALSLQVQAYSGSTRLYNDQARLSYC